MLSTAAESRNLKCICYWFHPNGVDQKRVGKWVPVGSCLLRRTTAHDASTQSEARCISSKLCDWAGQVRYCAASLSLSAGQRGRAVNWQYSFCAESAYSFSCEQWMNEWCVVAWWGWLLFWAPAGLPALLLFSRQGLWEWSGDDYRLLIAGCWSCSLQPLIVWLWNKLQSLVAWLNEGTSI